MNWSVLPDLAAIGLLAAAFASVARRNKNLVSGVWLIGWAMILLHFAAFLFLSLPGVWGALAATIGLAALTWGGLLFMWASVPYNAKRSSRWMLAALIFSNTLYVFLLNLGPAPGWVMDLAACFLGAFPLAITLTSLRKFNHPLRWTVSGLYFGLTIFLLAYQNVPNKGSDLAIDAVLFTVYLGCCVHFWYCYRRATAGAFVTIAGFFAWANVFVVAPLRDAFFPSVTIEAEVWNLPKYVVAVGMILILLEDQLEHNRHLALHDHLTGLPNRRLYLDRLASALERARRCDAQTALMVIDLDGFKEVNDTMGHHVGDLVLQRVATLFASRVRRSDTVARTGGDEFSVILEEPTSRAEAAFVGVALMHMLDETLEFGEHRVHIGASVGIAIFPEDAKDMESLCIAADRRMYDTKHGVSTKQGEAGFPAASALPLREKRRRASGLQMAD